MVGLGSHVMGCPLTVSRQGSSRIRANSGTSQDSGIRQASAGSKSSGEGVCTRPGTKSSGRLVRFDVIGGFQKRGDTQIR
jgi:hypothetical protein